LVLPAVFLLVFGGLTLMPAHRAAQAQSGSGGGSSSAMKKLSPALQQVVNGTINTRLAWYDPTASTPYVQVLIQTYTPDTAALRQDVTGRGGAVLNRFVSINGIQAWLPKSKILDIANRSDVERMTPDHIAEKSVSKLEKAVGILSSLRTFDAATNSFTGLDGTGVGIAVLDSGVDPANGGFKDANGQSRIAAQADFVQMNAALQDFKNSHPTIVNGFWGRDFSDLSYAALSYSGVSIMFRPWQSNPDKYGHGTFVAGVAAGRGAMVNGNMDYTGVAPGAKIISAKVLDDDGVGQLADVIRGIDWLILHKGQYNIRVMNLSLAGNSTESYQTDPLCRAVRKAVQNGIVVVAAAGNYGQDSAGREVYGTIASPGNDPAVITVGSANTFQTDTRTDERVNNFSSRGPTRSYSVTEAGVKVFDNFLKPDLVAPGNKIVSMESSGNKLAATYEQLNVADPNATTQIMQLSGTSVSAPAVSGAVALMLQQNPGLTPPLVKAILQYTAQSLPDTNLAQQGAGLLNVAGAVALTKVLRTDVRQAIANNTIRPGDNLLAAGAVFPAPQTYINGQTYKWSGYIFAGGNHILGGDTLFKKYQPFYNPALLWAGAKVTLNGAPVESANLFTPGVKSADGLAALRSVLTNGRAVRDGLLAGQGILLSDGILLSEGILLSDGILLSEGILLSDGILLSEGILLSDGILLSEGILLSDGTPFAQSLLCAEAKLLGE
jgi:subtilisin family serine protease